MNQQTQKPQNNESQKIQGLISNPVVFLNSEREVITHHISEGVRIEMPINFYKQILGIPFTKKEKSPPETQTAKKNVYGLLARPSVYKSKDGQYLVHQVLGVRVSKHINFYKKILGVEYTPKTKSA